MAEDAGDVLHPLDRVGSLKTKLGLLVGVSVFACSLLVAAGTSTGVPAALTIPVAVGLALAVTQLLAAGMIAPLREMTRAAGRMARGRYDVQVRASSRDEVGELARTFNRMARDLAEVDQRRRDLVADVSHELRTPLAGLAATLENVSDGVLPAAQGLATASAQVDRLAELVDDLLQLSRADAGAQPLDLAAVDLGELAEDAAELTRARNRSVRLTVTVPAGLQVLADAGRLRQVLDNLLDNAVRHSPPDGEVVVSAGRGGATWWLEVRDEGPGIPPDLRRRVFERFGTADPSTGGTGLGLAIAAWIAQLHGGRLRALSPDPGEPGARLRLDLPTAPPPAGGPTTGDTMATPVAPAEPEVEPAPSDWGSSLLGDAAGVGPRRDVLLSAVAVGVLAGLVLPFHDLGLAATSVLLAGGAVLAHVLRPRLTAFGASCGVLASLLCLVPTLRDAEWLAVLSVLAAVALALTALVDGRTVADLFLAGLRAATAPLRGLPWLGRTLAAFRGVGGVLPVVRTVLLSLVLLLVFGLLFASGDAVVGAWAADVLPGWTFDAAVLRLFVGLGVFGALLAAAYVGLEHARPAPRPAPARRVHRFEWLAPVLVVDGVFAVFLAAQATVFFGGEEHLRRTTGLTYAEYVHQGFGQLVVASVLTLLVIRAAGSRARLDSRVDRRWLRLALGVLCLLTLVVVGSALHRLDLYQDAYGFTVPRVLAGVFEAWLGLVVVLVLVAGLRLRGDWLARAGLLTGAGAMLVLAAINPEGWIATHNLERYHATGKLDVSYLASLSADAVPAVLAGDLRPPVCGLPDLGHRHDGWLEFNLGRHRARAALAEHTLPDIACPATFFPATLFRATLFRATLFRATLFRATFLRDTEGRRSP